MQNREDTKRKAMQNYSRMLYRDFAYRNDVSIGISCRDREYEVFIVFKKRNNNIYRTDEKTRKFSFDSTDSVRKIETILTEIYRYDHLRN